MLETIVQEILLDGTNSPCYSADMKFISCNNCGFRSGIFKARGIMKYRDYVPHYYLWHLDCFGCYGTKVMKDAANDSTQHEDSIVPIFMSWMDYVSPNYFIMSVTPGKESSMMDNEFIASDN
jgi:hypothetical protein